MADRTIHVLTPATSLDFLTLAECKTLLGITATSPTTDAQLQMFIDINSASVMRLCNRIFARETVNEIWRDIGDRRLFLSHWPVVASDITSVTETDGAVTVDPADYELEENSGKLTRLNAAAWQEPVSVTYTGGYSLPDDAPLPLKQATVLMVRDFKFAMSVEAVSGIRSIQYRDRKVDFVDPIRLLTARLGGGTGVNPAVDALLSHYTRLEV